MCGPTVEHLEGQINEETVAPVWNEAYQTNVDPSVIRWGADAATSASAA